jgi:acyl-[acyl-carrier-protein]-phospholipid O-acyltransferase/long-chain-fatty-acid--[acyl-carrier-protein] ligase
MNTTLNACAVQADIDQAVDVGFCPPVKLDKIFDALIGRNGFSALVCTQFLGAFNDNLYKMIVSLLAVSAAIEVGGVGAYLSAASIVFILPYLLFSGYAGFLADRLDKRTVLIGGKIFEIAVMAMAFAALVVGRIEFLFATLFFMAVQSTFYSPAKYGILPETLPATLLSRANGVLEMSRYIAVILGTVAGGLLLTLLSDRPGYIGAILVIVACAGALASLKIDNGRRPDAHNRFRVNPWSEVLAGVRRLAVDRRLGPAVAGLTFLEFLGTFVLLDILLVGKELLALNDTWTSLLGAFAGIGIGAGAFLAGKFSRDRIEIGLVPIGACGAALVLLGAAQVTGAYPSVAAAVTLIGFFGGLLFVPLNALLQHASVDKVRGNLIATNTFLNMFGVLVACVSLWLLRDVVGLAPDKILTLAGLLTTGATLAFLKLQPEYRDAASNWLRETYSVSATAHRANGQTDSTRAERFVGSTSTSECVQEFTALEPAVGRVVR